MNLVEESFQKKEEKNKKMALRIILSVIVLLVVAIVSIIGYLIYVENNTLRLFLNGQSTPKIKELLEIEQDGTIYVPIKEIANYLGYDSYNGEYSEKSENQSKCYIQDKNRKEIANFTLNSKKVYKLDLTSSTGNYEYVYADEPVKAKEGMLYASSEMIEKAFNVIFEYDKDKKTINIYTMPYMIEFYSTRILDYGYNSISDVFANQKAVLDDILVVRKEDKCGVIDVQGNPILEPKYDNITYLPNIGDFLVESGKKVGIMSKNRKTKVDIDYDSIELMDSDLELYVVRKDNKYGVIDFKGNLKIYIENDEIGMNISNFEKNNIKNKYILAGNLIPARRDNLWGLYDKNGKLVVDYIYDGFGYVASSNKNVFNLLVIPEYNVLVACKEGKYTLLSSTGKELFAAPVADDIYMTITENAKHYYISANNGTMDATVYLDRIGVAPSKASQNTTNTINNASNNSDEPENSNINREENTNSKSFDTENLETSISTSIEQNTQKSFMNIGLTVVSSISILLLIIGPIIVIIYAIKSKKTVGKKILFGTIVIGLPILLFITTTILQVFINVS